LEELMMMVVGFQGGFLLLCPWEKKLSGASNGGL
jgi:hypothetical protein